MLTAVSKPLIRFPQSLNLSSRFGARADVWSRIGGTSRSPSISRLPLIAGSLQQPQASKVQISYLSTLVSTERPTDQKFQIQWSVKPNKPLNEPLEKLLGALWKEHIESNPGVLKVFKAFCDQGEGLVFDHFAYRTLVTKEASTMGVKNLAQLFSGHDYQTRDYYDFPADKLNALHMEPASNGYPRIFISEFRVDSLSRKAQLILNRVAKSCEDKMKEISSQPDAQPTDFLTSGRSWPIYKVEYDALKLESDYAAWFYLFGHRVNHFALSFDHSEKFQDLEGVNQFVKDLGVPLNTKGGEIKDAPGKLAQSSTEASKAMVVFDSLQPGECEYKEYPLTFVEFVSRAPVSPGSEERYSGFVAGNAERIFKSTDDV